MLVGLFQSFSRLAITAVGIMPLVNRISLNEAKAFPDENCL